MSMCCVFTCACVDALERACVCDVGHGLDDSAKLSSELRRDRQQTKVFAAVFGLMRVLLLTVCRPTTLHTLDYWLDCLFLWCDQRKRTCGITNVFQQFADWPTTSHSHCTNSRNGHY